MDRFVVDILPNLGEEDCDLFLAPTKHPSQNSDGKSFKSFEVIHVHIVPLANLFVLHVFWPSVAGPFKDCLNNIHEPCITQDVLVLLVVLEWTANLGRGLIKKVNELR